jgi:hypothetical protein
MGSSDQEKGRYGNEGPMHKVCILAAFELRQFEVTQGEWRRVMIFQIPLIRPTPRATIAAERSGMGVCGARGHDDIALLGRQSG